MGTTRNPPVSSPTYPNIPGLVQLCLGATAISFSAVFVKVAHVGPSVSGMYRTLFGGLLLLLATLLKREQFVPSGRSIFLCGVCGLFFALDLWFWHRSIHYIGPGLATLLANFQVFFLAIIGIILFGEKPSWRFVAAVPLAITGLSLIVGLDLGGLAFQYKIGLIFGLMTAVWYTAYILLFRKSQNELRSLSAMANLAYISLFTALLFFLESTFRHESLVIPDAQTWLALLAYGCLCQAVGWMLIAKGLSRTRTSLAGLILLLQPTLSFVWDVLFFDRPTTPVEGLGAALAIGAIYMGITGRRGIS
ncbi:MAG: DMT family transporter [Deltaproteobacteria bacterium]|nr:DMT family transporter [Deltaproteobacteria bacterium]